MLNLITMTPSEHRSKYVQRTESGRVIDDSVEEIFGRYVAHDAYDRDDGKPLVGELATKPVYAEYIAKFHGSECDNSPLRIGEKGYTIECDSYISPIHSLRKWIKTGLCILCAANHGIKIYTNKDDLDKYTIEFLAKREEEYTVYVNLFSEYVTYDWNALDISLYDRITIDGEKLTKENFRDLIFSDDEIIQMYPEYVVQSKKEFESRNTPSYHDPYRFDTAVTLPARDFIMDIERIENTRRMKEPLNSDEEKKLEEEVRSGKCTKIFLGYEAAIHAQNLKKESVTKYPIVFAVREFEDGSMECENYHFVKDPSLLEMLENLHEDVKEKGCSRAMYAVWDKSYLINYGQYNMDLFDDVDMYFEIDVKNKQLHIYDKGYFGRKKFFEFYRDDAKFIPEDF